MTPWLLFHPPFSSYPELIYLHTITPEVIINSFMHAFVLLQHLRIIVMRQDPIMSYLFFIIVGVTVKPGDVAEAMDELYKWFIWT